MRKGTDDDDAVRAAAQELLRQGEATPAEIANTLNRSRQSVRYWAGGIKWQEARARRVAARLFVAVRGARTKAQ